MAGLEREARNGRYNTLCLRAAGGVATVLGEYEVVERAIQLLSEAPDGAFWAGMITNIQLPETLPERMRTIGPIKELEEQYPQYSEDKLVGRVQSYATCQKYLALCLEGLLQEARVLASSGLQFEEMGAALALLGEFDAASSIASDPNLESFRQRGIKFVLVIELFRRGRIEEATRFLSELESDEGINAWDRIHLALGFAGREPWGGYPFPDW